jgi:hypothetical protein
MVRLAQKSGFGKVLAIIIIIIIIDCVTGLFCSVRDHILSPRGTPLKPLLHCEKIILSTRGTPLKPLLGLHYHTLMSKPLGMKHRGRER